MQELRRFKIADTENYFSFAQQNEKLTDLNRELEGVLESNAAAEDQIEQFDNRIRKNQAEIERIETEFERYLYEIENQRRENEAMKIDIKGISRVCGEMAEFIQQLAKNPLDHHDILAADN